RIVQETRLWEADRGYTRSMRSKEFAHDYRYFPEPDLVPLRLPPPRVGGPAHRAEGLPQSRALAGYYEASVQALGAPPGSRGDRPKAVSNWIMSELLATLPGDDELAIQRSRIPPTRLAGLLRLIEDGTISGKIAKDVFQKMLASGDDAATIVGREGLTQVADEAALSQIIVTVMAANPKAIDDFKRGKKEAKGALVGQVMKATGGRGNPPLVTPLLEDKLAKTKSRGYNRKRPP